MVGSDWIHILTPPIGQIWNQYLWWPLQWLGYYRVFHSKTIFLRWIKMTLKYIVHIKETYFYNHKDSPFDMKHQLMSADSLPVVKFDLSWKTIFHKFFFDFCRVNDLFAKLYFPLVSTWKSSTLSFMTCVGHILKFLESILMI